MIESIKKADVLNKDVLIRLDLNVPFDKGRVTDSSRIMAVLPTIDLILKKGGRPILLSHFGRPKEPYDDSLSLKNILPKLIKVLKGEIQFCNTTDPDSIKVFIRNVPKTKIILLENTRFFKGEESNSTTLSNSFSEFGDLYCNDAFSASHRKHASTVGIADRLPSYAGLLLEKELVALSKALLSPKKPLVAIVGGSKVSTKITLLKNLVKKVDHLIIGGGMANTFLHSKNKQIGRSLCEKNLSKLCKEILLSAKKFNCNIHLPVDIICAYELKKNQEITTHNINLCPPDKMILDCGPNTVSKICNILKKSNTLIWNGPLGAFETVPFNFSTEEVANLAAKLTKTGQLKSIAGGGDTVSALKSAKVLNDFSYVSYAGGAFLEWMEGKELPGIKALEKKKDENKKFNF